jgi:nitrite reductase (NADH) large subunit
MKASALSVLFIAQQLATDVESFGIKKLFARKSQLQATNGDSDKKRVVVIGNGMVGQRFMENLIDLDKDKKCVISTFCEEPRAAYNRVKLTSYFETRNPSALSMTSEFDDDGRTPWYEENNVELLLNDKVVSVDTKTKTVTGASGKTIDYDVAVFATGSYPFVPPIPGKQRPGVFVYRVSCFISFHFSCAFTFLHVLTRTQFTFLLCIIQTIEDLEAMLAYVKENNVKSAAVIGGGLLGLEAAKAVADMKVESHIIEFAPILMCRQIDQGGHDALVGKIEEMGLKVHCGARTESFVGENGSTDMEDMSPVSALRFSNEGWADLDVQMVVVSAGIKPRDELARDTDITVGERGGIVVDEQLKTSVDGTYAIGEIALYNNFIYGLIAPGYDMAGVCSKIVAQEELGYDLGLEETPAFTGADLSTKLKLLGCDVASFGENQPSPDDPDVSNLVWNDPLGGIYRKLIFNKAGTKLRGGILVGDASDYSKLHKLAIQGGELPENPAMLLAPASARGDVEEEELSDDPNTQICSCNDVTRGQIADTIKELGVDGASLKEVKTCSKAGTGCGGCEPDVKMILKQELEKLGGSLSNNLCEHFAYSRPELMALVRTDEDPSSVDSFDKILHKHGHGVSSCIIARMLFYLLPPTNFFHFSSHTGWM